MRKNKSVQTGAKIQEGGLRGDLIISVTYQLLTELAVKRPPRIPVPSVIKIDRKNLTGLNLVLFFDFIIKYYTI